MVWILKYEAPEDCEVEVTAYNSRDEACKEALAQIQDIISNEWDLNNLEQAQEAKVINDLISQGSYRSAVRSWNDSSTNTDGRYPRYWYILDRDILTSGTAPVVFDEAVFAVLNSDDDEEEGEEDTYLVDPNTSGPYQATTPGATCRGPSCGTVSSYAYADKPDGTYLCHSCKMMIAVFGGINKP